MITGQSAPHYPTHQTSDALYAMRREIGTKLQALREARGLSQKELARILNFQQYNFISQIETGRRALPVDRYIIYAQALDIDAKSFVELIMRYYDPYTYEILFGSVANGASIPEHPTE